MTPTAVILAGGRSSRMGGGDKCLLALQGRPILAHVVEALRSQCLDILVNANSAFAGFAAFDLPLLPDVIPGFQGPLAGVLTGMLWSRRQHPRVTHILSVPGDVPFLPAALAPYLARSLDAQRGDIAIACCADRSHPTIGLWPVDLAERLQQDLLETNIRSLHDWLCGFRVARARFDGHAFFNINTPADLDACSRDSHPWDGAGRRRIG